MKKSDDSTPPTKEIQPGVPYGTADKPATEDLLGRKPWVDALAAMFAAPKQGTPLTVALFGDWGAGKTSVMRQLEAELQRSYPGQCDFAWFNAWEYEQTDALRVGMVEQIVRGLSAAMPAHRMILLRFQRIWQELREEWFILSIGLVGVVALVIAITVEMNQWVSSAIAGVTLPIFLFSKVWKQIPAILEHPMTSRLASVLRGTDYGKYLGMIPVMKRQIKALCDERLGRRPKSVRPRRLVVFVDDLDRCGPESISETFEAVRLVMDLPDVIVVIGIDERIAIKAMEVRYEKLADAQRTKRAIARDYLEKIIQLPIRLSRPEPADLKRYISQRLFRDAVVSQLPLGEGADAPDEGKLFQAEFEPTPNGDIPDESHQKTATPPDVDIEVVAEPQRDHEPSTVVTPATPERRQLEQAMLLTNSERSLFIELSELFSLDNPRRLLHLGNWYRLLKTMGLMHTPTDGEPKQDPDLFMPVLFWLEFLYRVPVESQQACIACLWDQDALKAVDDEQAAELLSQEDEVTNLLRKPLGMFTNQSTPKSTKLYTQVVSFVRNTVMPSGGQPLLHSRGENEKWFDDWMKRDDVPQPKVEAAERVSGRNP